MSSENTQDLAKFGYRELSETVDLLKEYCKLGCNDFFSDGVAVELNPNSGYVFLVDDEYNVGMLNDGKLEQYLNCPECGREGFVSELKADGGECCWKYLVESGFVDESERLEEGI
jgi:hypothetical protein